MLRRVAPPVEGSSTPVALRFLAFPIGAAIGQVLLMLDGHQLPSVAAAAAILLVTYCWFNVAGSFHESAHQTLFRSVRANVWLGRIIGTLIFIPYTAYKETHRLHHAYLNTEKDPELWPYGNPAWSRRSRRVFAWIDLLFALVTTPVIYGRVAWIRPSLIKTETRRVIVGEYLAIALFWLLVVLLTWQAMATGHLSGSAMHPLWLSPLVLSYSLNCGRKFTEHLGLASTHPVYGTRTVMGSGWLTRLSSFLNFDIYIHGPHHRFPRARHDELPRRLEELKHQATEPLPVFASYREAVLDMLPSLLANPAVGTNVSDRGAPEKLPTAAG